MRENLIPIAYSFYTRYDFSSFFVKIADNSTVSSGDLIMIKIFIIYCICNGGVGFWVQVSFQFPLGFHFAPNTEGGLYPQPSHLTNVVPISYLHGNLQSHSQSRCSAMQGK